MLIRSERDVVFNITFALIESFMVAFFKSFSGKKEMKK